MKTKKILYSTILAVVMGGNFSCKKAIDLQPSHAVFGDEYFTKIEDYEKALTGAYTRLLADSYYGTSNTGANAFVGLTDFLSDNFYESVESLGNQQDFYRWTYTADDVSIADCWLDGYRVVQQANLVLRGIDAFASGSPGAVNRVRAQAIALRAMAHFDLLRYFGKRWTGILRRKEFRTWRNSTSSKSRQDLPSSKPMIRSRRIINWPNR